MGLQKTLRNRRAPKPTVKQMKDFSVEVSALAIQHERDLDALHAEHSAVLAKLAGIRKERLIWAIALVLSLAVNARMVAQ